MKFINIVQKDGIIKFSEKDDGPFLMLDINMLIKNNDVVSVANFIAEYFNDALNAQNIKANLHDENGRNQYEGTCFEHLGGN